MQMKAQIIMVQLKGKAEVQVMQIMEKLLIQELAVVMKRQVLVKVKMM